MEGSGTDDPGTVDDVVTPQVRMSVQNDVIPPGDRHRPKEIASMSVGEPQTHAGDFQLPPYAVEVVSESPDRRLENIPIPVAVAQNPVDLEALQDSDGLGAGNVTTVNHGLDVSVGENPSRSLQSIEAIVTVGENSDHHDAAVTIVPSLVSSRIVPIIPRPHPRVRQQSSESAVREPVSRSA